MNRKECEQKKMLMVATVPSVIGLFNMNNLKLLIEMGFVPQIACNFKDLSFWGERQIENFKNDLKNMNITFHQIDFSRNPLNIKSHLTSYRQMKALIRKGKFNFIHCHTPIASAITRIIAYKNKTKLIYTAHGFHFYKGAPWKNWLIYYPIEKICSYFTDVLITINREDYVLAKKKFHAKKVKYVPGVGIDTDKFYSHLIDINDKRRDLGLSKQDIMLLSVGELSSRKNHEVVIKALYELRDEKDFSKIHYYICGKGDLLPKLQEMVAQLDLGDTIQFMGYRTDISELCQAADLYIFPSIQEELPVALMEAIAYRIPVICSDIRGNVDLIDNRNSLFPPKDVKKLSEILKGIMLNSASKIERATIQTKMKDSVDKNYVVLQKYDLSAVAQIMLDLYAGVIPEDIESDILLHCTGLPKVVKRHKYLNDLKIAPNAIVLLSVGELNENKNHITVIRALQNLDRNIHYLIAGMGALNDELEKEATNLGLKDRVHLLGYRTDVADLLEIADVYLLASIREGLNVSIMEAMASGLPCICSDIRGNRDLVANYKGGFLVRSVCVDDWCKAIRKIIDGDWNQMGRYNLKMIHNFTSDVVYDKMKKIYGIYSI